jgi:ferredoxin
VETEKFKISFEEKFPEVTLDGGSQLSENLTVENSPILFGCRIGICGTCAIEILEDTGIHSRTQEEIEYLDAICPEITTARLACQIRLCANLKVRKISI